MNFINAGVIGLGFIGPQHIDAICRAPDARLAAVCDADENAAHAAAERYHVEKVYTDWRQMIADPDIQVVHNCTPHFLHEAINEAALLAGKHVYAEKPLAQSAAGARRLIGLAGEHPMALGLNHQYRMNAAVQEMKARFAHGLPGRPLMLWGRYLQESASQETDWSPKMENTGIARCINDIGIHWVDTACAVLGQPVAEVMAELTTHYPVRRGPDGAAHPMTTEDTGMILLRFADGTPGQLLTSKASNGHKNDLRLTVDCENYSMEWRQEEPDRLRIGEKGVGTSVTYPNPRTCQSETRPYITLPVGHVMGWADALRNSVDAFYRSIADESWRTSPQPYASFEDGFRGMAFVEACVRSSKERRWVKVEQL